MSNIGSSGFVTHRRAHRRLVRSARSSLIGLLFFTLLVANFSAFSGIAFAAPGPAANLDQCANGTLASPNVPACNPNEWVNGNVNESKAHYFEGDSIPYRMKLSNFTPGVAVHTLTIEWDSLKGGKHAIDYLTTYNRTVTTANPCVGVSGCVFPDAPSTAPIPFNADAPAGQVAGVFTLFGGSYATFLSV